MSMKPGATIKPLASIVRAASPARLGPIAAIRSPSSATSATTPGAPLPSTTVPFLMRSDQGMLGRSLQDLHRLHLVTLLDVVHDVHPRDDLSEDGVLAVEEVRGGEHDVELATRRVGIVAPRHGDRAAHVLVLVELGLDLVSGAARTVALGVAALDHEAGLDAVEGQAIVKALFRERDEVLDGLGRVIGEK